MSQSQNVYMDVRHPTFKSSLDFIFISRNLSEPEVELVYAFQGHIDGIIIPDKLLLTCIGYSWDLSFDMHGVVNICLTDLSMDAIG